MDLPEHSPVRKASSIISQEPMSDKRGSELQADEHSISLEESTLAEMSSTTFPDVIEVFSMIIRVIKGSKDPLFQDYGRFIDQKLVNSDLPSLFRTCIDTDVLECLQGEKIDIGILNYVKERQARRKKKFQGEGGYLDFITDDRDESYLKFYVGQASSVSRRISQHRSSFARGQTDSLHYYIFALGQEYRHSDFIRLFRSPSEIFGHLDPNREDVVMLMNILELAMGIAFRSLTQNVLNRFETAGHGDSEEINMHLNVLNPLEQSQLSFRATRIHARNQMRFSSDAEIRSWASFREKVVSKRLRMGKGLSSFEVLREKLAALFQLELSETTDDHMHDLDLIPNAAGSKSFDILAACRKISEDNRLGTKLDLPVGSLQGTLVVIYGSSQQHIHKSPQLETDQNALPFGLDKVGLTTQNSLVWSSNFGLASKTEISELLANSPSLYNKLKDLSAEILDASSAKIVILCGTHTQSIISEYREKLNLSERRLLKFQGQEISLHLDIRDRKIRRIYLDTPKLLDVAFGHGWEKRRNMSSVLKISSLFLKLKNFHYRFYERAYAKDGMFDALGRAKRGEKITPDSLNDALIDWLACRGFETAEDFRELAEIGDGSLGVSVHILFQVLGRIAKVCRKDQAPEDWKQLGIVFNESPQYSKSVKEKMANLWSKKMKEKQLSLLQVSIGGGQETVQEILDDMAMRTTPQEEDIQDVGESSVSEKEISSYLEGFRSASFLASQRELLKATDGEVEEIDPQLEAELFYEQKKELALAQEIEVARMQAVIPSMIKDGLSFHQIRWQSPLYAVNTVRTAYNSRFVGRKREPTIMKHRRIERMFGEEGLVFHTNDLHIMAHRLNYHFTEEHHSKQIMHGIPLRVWIRILKPTDAQDPWYADDSDPHLQTFIFRVAQEHQTVEDSIPFFPEISGYESPRTIKPPGEKEAKTKELARKIVEKHDAWLSKVQKQAGSKEA